MAAEIIENAQVFLRCDMPDEHVLFLQDVNGADTCYELPGGRLEVGESGREAVVRQVHQQTGIELDGAMLLRFYTNTEVPYRPATSRQIGRLVLREFFVGMVRSSSKGVVPEDNGARVWLPRTQVLVAPRVAIAHKAPYQYLEDAHLWNRLPGYAA